MHFLDNDKVCYLTFTDNSVREGFDNLKTNQNFLWWWASRTPSYGKQNIFLRHSLQNPSTCFTLTLVNLYCSGCLITNGDMIVIPLCYRKQQEQIDIL